MNDINTEQEKNIKIALPDTLHGMTRLALSELEKVEKQTDIFTVNMRCWLNPTYIARTKSTTIMVGLSGAVMAHLLEVERWNIHHHPECFGNDGWKLRALDSIQDGDILTASSHMQRSRGVYDALPGMMDLKRKLAADGLLNIPRYDKDASAFKQAMTRLAEALEKHGI